MQRLAAALAILIPVVGAASAADRLVPDFPEPGQRIRLVIDTDAACEIDDLYALALAVTAQDRFDIEGFVAAHFGDAGGPDGIDRSYEQIKTVLEKAGLADKFPVKRGAPPFQYSAVAPEAEGVDFIIERALADDQTWATLPSSWIPRSATAKSSTLRTWNGICGTSPRSPTGEFGACTRSTGIAHLSCFTSGLPAGQAGTSCAYSTSRWQDATVTIGGRQQHAALTAGRPAPASPGRWVPAAQSCEVRRGLRFA